MPDSRAVTMKVTEDQMDECTHCSVSITSDTDKQWVVANVYTDCCILSQCKRCGGTGRRWFALEHWHEECYDGASAPYGPSEFKKTKASKGQEEDGASTAEEWD